MPFWLYMMVRRHLFLIVFVAWATSSWGQPFPSDREFRPGSVDQLSDVPEGRLRSQIERLPLPARNRALVWLDNFHFTDRDLESLQVDPSGAIYYADQAPPLANSAPGSVPETAGASVPVTPFPADLIFHSRPGAPNVLYLNFSGENVSGTAWNNSIGRSSIPAVPFSSDSDISTFSDAEQLKIRRIWQRVAEDFSSFEIDVTTERPSSFGPRTAHALITRNTDANGDPNPSSAAGGVAYVGVFGSGSYSNYRPAWVYSNNLSGDDSYIAEATSHEIGHNLGLSHDGTTSGSEYYGGHGSGDISWGPIMGASYNRNVTQWSKGDYRGANNSQDDLATIASKLSYRYDDHGDTSSSASPLSIAGGTDVISSTPETDPDGLASANKGVLDTTADVDVFSFATGSGPIQLAVNSWVSPSGRTVGGNLDVSLKLYDAGGTLILSDNPSDDTQASVSAQLSEGIYYLHVGNSGTGDPLAASPSGYTEYGSTGQYFISGFVVPSGLVIPPGAELSIADITEPGEPFLQFVVTYTDNLAVAAETIDGADILVTGPNGFAQLARLTGKSSNLDTASIVATYQVDPPDGAAWVEADNGSYLVSMQMEQVGDIEEAWVPHGPIGQFTVNVPKRIYFAGMDGDPGWGLDALWQYGAPTYTSGGPVSGFTGGEVIAYNLAGNYDNRLDPVYATTPTIDFSGVESATLRFRRWLKLKNGDTAAIEISTDNLAWVKIWETSKTVSDNSWREVQYALPGFVAGRAAVRLRWVISSGPARNDIGWNIDDVEILGDGAVDALVPTASLSVANITTDGSPVHEFAVTYTDNIAMDVSTFGNSDLVVTGPNGSSNLVEFVGVDVPQNGTPRTVAYSLPAPGVLWSAADNGVYDVRLLSSEVADVNGNSIEETALGQFTVAISTNQQMLIVGPSVLDVPEGGTGIVNVRLAEPPSADVVVTMNYVGGDPDLRIESGGTNVFTSQNWSTSVPVVFRALPDADQENGTASFECRSDGLATVDLLLTENDNTPDVTLVVTSSNPAWGAVNPTEGTFAVGTSVQLSATPMDYYEFVEWSGDRPGTTNPLTVVLDSNVTQQAEFRESVTTNHFTPHWWLASLGYASDFETAELLTGANGLPLWQSYTAGLDPNDPASQLRLSVSSGPDADTVVLRWNTVTNRVYTLLQSNDVELDFVPLPAATALPSTVQSYTNATAAGAPFTYYRIEVQKPGSSGSTP